MLFTSRGFLQTEQLGAELCRKLGPRMGDVVLLRGEIGCGKSVFARGFIREAMGNSNLRVQSPTFLLQQEYETRSVMVNHFDLYRFQPEMTLVDAKAMDWLICLTNGASLIEWPERIQSHSTVLLPKQQGLRYIDVTVSWSQNDEDEREVYVKEL